MNVNFQFAEEKTKQSGIVAALKKRALELMDEVNFKLVLELENVLKNTQESLISGKCPESRPKKYHFMEKCEEKIMQKKNLSCDVSHIKEELTQGYEKNLKTGGKLVAAQCNEIEKSMNLLREKCETFQNSLISKENEIYDLTQDNARLTEENFELKNELAQNQQYLTKMIMVFERELKEKVNPFKDKTSTIVNSENSTTSIDFFSPKVTALSQNTSPLNFMFLNKAKRFLKFGDENAF